MKTYLLFFDWDDADRVRLPSMLVEFNLGIELYTFDRNICFIKTKLSLHEVASKLKDIFEGRQFFVTEIDSASHAGSMLPSLWDFLRRQDTWSSAA